MLYYFYDSVMVILNPYWFPLRMVQAISCVLVFILGVASLKCHFEVSVYKKMHALQLADYLKTDTNEVLNENKRREREQVKYITGWNISHRYHIQKHRINNSRYKPASVCRDKCDSRRQPEI